MEAELTASQQPKVLGTLQTAQRLGKSKSFVFYLVKTNQLHPQNIGGGVFVFFADDVESYIEQNKLEQNKPA